MPYKWNVDHHCRSTYVMLGIDKMLFVLTESVPDMTFLADV